MPMPLSEMERQIIKEKLDGWLLIIAGAFLLLLIRFWVLQVVKNELYSSIAKNNQIRQITVPPMRGNIYDRNGFMLADWEQSFNVLVTPADINDDALNMLANILSTTPEAIKERMEENRSWSPFIPVQAAEDITWDQFAKVEENRLAMPGVDTELRPVRKYYPESIYVSHLIGYMGEITRDMMNDPRFADYRMGDRLGVSGLERALELTLRGRPGLTSKLVDAKGREISADNNLQDMRGRLDYTEKLRELEAMARPVEPGKSVVLTIDIGLQKIASDAMGGNIGSVVIMDVKNGELLALLSKPAFNPSLFVKGIGIEAWKQMRDDPDHPLLNRAITSAYPPGSIFKIVMAAGGLDDGFIKPGTRQECTGLYTLANQNFRCWNRTGHGNIAVEQAIIQSCDVFFYKLGEKMGVWEIAKWARRFGLGSPIHIGLDQEKAGLVPDPDWKQRVRHRQWYPGETILISIGQGYMLVTPLQAVLMPAAVANNGTLLRPQLIHHLEDAGRKPLTKFEPRVMARGLISQPTLKILREGMDGVVNAPDGTARNYVRSDVIRIAGKTGTSEVSKRYQGRPLEETPVKYRDHAWFIAYAPADDPKIAIVVMVEHGGSGGAAAGSVARKILEEYFSANTAMTVLGPPGG
ncbi:MAG TPA: penicillin-binding protein 2 [bacterium]|nr:penicillin-binding protein 2 [bacterium]